MFFGRYWELFRNFIFLFLPIVLTYASVMFYFSLQVLYAYFYSTIVRFYFDPYLGLWYFWIYLSNLHYGRKSIQFSIWFIYDKGHFELIFISRWLLSSQFIVFICKNMCTKPFFSSILRSMIKQLNSLLLIFLFLWLSFHCVTV